MDNLRVYGKQPYNIAIIHGGPGAPGSVAPMGRELSLKYGVIEPFQTMASINEQIKELASILGKYSTLPVTLIGHSWGAWLSYMVAAKYPTYIKKLILIGSGAYESKYITTMNDVRSSRLSKEENKRVEVLGKLLFNPHTENSDQIFREFGSIMTKVDSYEPIVYENETIKFQPEIFNKVMPELNELRKSGELLNMGQSIKCPVVAIHGDYDGHPYEGVKEPLSKVIKEYKFILLKNCGHYPWNEKYAKNKFYEALLDELE